MTQVKTQGECENPKAKLEHAAFCWAVGEIYVLAPMREYSTKQNVQARKQKALRRYQVINLKRIESFSEEKKDLAARNLNVQ